MNMKKNNDQKDALTEKQREAFKKFNSNVIYMIQSQRIYDHLKSEYNVLEDEQTMFLHLKHIYDTSKWTLIATECENKVNAVRKKQIKVAEELDTAYNNLKEARRSLKYAFGGPLNLPKPRF